MLQKFRPRATYVDAPSRGTVRFFDHAGLERPFLERFAWYVTNDPYSTAPEMLLHLLLVSIGFDLFEPRPRDIEVVPNQGSRKQCKFIYGNHALEGKLRMYGGNLSHEYADIIAFDHSQPSDVTLSKVILEVADAGIVARPADARVLAGQGSDKRLDRCLANGDKRQ